MQKGMRAVYKADGSLGAVGEVYNGGFFCEFAADSGARFTVLAEELEVDSFGRIIPAGFEKQFPQFACAIAAGLEASRADQRRPFVPDAGRIVARVDLPPKKPTRLRRLGEGLGSFRRQPGDFSASFLR